MDKRYQSMQKGQGAATGSNKKDNSGLLVGLAAGAVALAAVYFYLSSVYN